MTIKILNKERAEQIGEKFFSDKEPLFGIPERFFDGTYKVIRKLQYGVEIEPDSRLIEVLIKIGIYEERGYIIPFQFIECVKEW